MYVPRRGAIIGNFLDIGSVEVSRGPQGTLFGRNASVGAIALRSVQPDSEFSGTVNAEYGTADRYKLWGHVNLPLSENVAARIAVMGSALDGYWRNALDGRTYGRSDDFASRVSIKAELGALEWLVRGDYAVTDGDGFVPNEFESNSVSASQLAAFQNQQIALAGSAADPVLFDRNVNQFITADLHDENWGISSDATLYVG